MREIALQIGASDGTDQQRRNGLREYLQHVLLREMFERSMLESLVFHGGTALRIVHGVPRFSEALDFHLPEPAAFDLVERVEGVISGLEDNGYRLSARLSTQRTVQSCTFRFEELLDECGLAARPEQKLRIKLEVDTNPAAGFRIERTPVDVHFPFVVVHHDRPTFIAGKLHAILQRPYAKGRDFYDLTFFLRHWKETTPNVAYLNNALAQTGYADEPVTEATWKPVVRSRVEAIDWSNVARDVEPFLLRPADRKAFEKEFLLELIAG